MNYFKWKKFNLARIVLLLTLAAMMISIPLSGCGSNPAGTGNAATTIATAEQATSAATSEPTTTSKQLDPVNLIMYLVTDPPKDAQLVYSEVNKLLQKDINTTLTVNFLTYAEVDEKYKLILSSGEPYDLIFAGTWVNSYDNAKKGAFMALDDLLPKYAPQTWSETPKNAWKDGTVNGKIYLIPSGIPFIMQNGWIVRGDLMKKYSIPEIHGGNLSDLETYLDSIKKNEKDIIPLNATIDDIYGLYGTFKSSQQWMRVGTGMQNLFFAYKGDDPSYKMLLTYKTPEFRDFARKMKSWADKGYWSKSVLVNETSPIDAFFNGTGAFFSTNLDTFNSLYMTYASKYPDWDLKFIPTDVDVRPQVGDAMAVSAHSQHPDRALMVMELFRNNQTYYDLTTYGIKGKHYELDANGNLIDPPGVAAADNGFPPAAACPWGWSQEKFSIPYATGWPLYNDVFAKAKETAAAMPVNPFGQFIMDDTSIKNEKASIADVESQYFVPLSAGMVNDFDKEYDNFVKKMDDAGVEKILAEIQKQVDAFKTANP